MNQYFILYLSQYLFEKNNYMDFLSHKAGCTRELFWVHMNLTFRSVTIPKFWDIGRVPILGLYQTKSIENTSPWSHYTQRVKLSVFIRAWVWRNLCTPNLKALFGLLSCVPPMSKRCRHRLCPGWLISNNISKNFPSLEKLKL